MKYGLFLFENEEEIARFEFSTLSGARQELQDQLEILSGHKKSNEYQATKNYKDRFHYYLKHENGLEVKRDFIISKVYRAKRYSVRTIIEAKEILKNKFIN